MDRVVQELGIAGAVTMPLKQIADDRGAVLHMLRCDSELFTTFGEIYFSEIRSGIIKAWKRHDKMTQHFAVPVGRIRLALFDDRADSRTRGKTETHELGRPNAYHLVRIPPRIWYGFQGLSQTPSLVANCTDLPHDPNESEACNVDAPGIPYRW